MFQLFLSKTSRFSSVLLIIISLFLVTNPFNAKAYQEVDRVIALVENSPITIKDLENLLTRQNQNLNRANIDLAFKKLINNRLLLVEANRINIQVNDQILDQKILNIAEQNKINLKELYQEIEKNYPGGYLTYREDIRFAILEEQIKQRIVFPRINQSMIKLSQDEEVVKENEQKERQILVQQIFVSNNNQTPYSKINEAYQKIKLGASFKEVAQLYSEEGNSIDERGEIMGWINFDSLDDELKSLYEGLEPHQFSTPKKRSQGWFIVKLVDSREIETETLNQMRAKIDQEKVDEELNLWLSELRAYSYIEIKKELLEEYLNQII